ncbi:hypothetical protein K466DRAFT_594862 [Polyporus arcularius HHB13444]|uniref:Uncharacterized protein n=1 Tax=Polyporus arcularius HHB13444 TaxID=1314778 RepID=A0A5C3PSS4_9APHY|nr:hypothetical protein K466DRAFT_594862 [Polyporus arcularius HHB13444]
MADVEEDGMDLETLQAQIDMSMAFTHDLVSGWMKASKVKLPSSSRADADRELEEHMRRPARLGVGASAPESTGVLSRETAKLRNKLVGNGKKRAREDDDAAGTASANSASKPVAISDDDDEDSRARVITKKARIDPFAPKTKEKKKAKVDPLQASAPPSASLSKKPAEDASTKAPLPQNTSSKEVEDGEGSSSPKKRRKKKKHKSHGDDAVPPEDPQSIASAPRETATTLLGKDRSDANVVNASTPDKGPSCVKLPVTAGHVLGDVASSQPHAPATPARAPSTAQSSPQRLDPFGMPLLNLSGPPPAAEDEQPAPSKKKRKKKKKKKQKVASDVDGAARPDGDGDDDDEEDG